MRRAALGAVLEVTASGEEVVGTRVLCSRCAHPAGEHAHLPCRDGRRCLHYCSNSPGSRRCACRGLVLPKTKKRRTRR